jgi:hypothetical protein
VPSSHVWLAAAEICWSHARARNQPVTARQRQLAWNLELGTWKSINDFVQKSCTNPDRNIQTTAYYEYTHNALAHLFLAHEGPNPLCAVVVIATTYESMYLALYRRDITLLFVVRHEQARPRETFTL